MKLPSFWSKFWANPDTDAPLFRVFKPKSSLVEVVFTDGTTSTVRASGFSTRDGFILLHSPDNRDNLTAAYPAGAIRSIKPRMDGPQ